MNNFRLLLLPVFAFTALSLFGQNTKPVPNTMSKTTASNGVIANQETPYCDELIPKVVEQLQKSAESTCKTATTCVLCLDRSTKAELYATLYAQPNSQKCKSVKDIAYAVQAPNQAALSLPFEILQSPCTKDGVNLTLSFPDANTELAKYTFSWEVDGKRIGQGQQVSCVCGKSAKVTIAEKGSKRTTSKTMSLQDACNSSRN